MSGLYLIAWNESKKIREAVLKTTAGGYPHITVAYTGTGLSAAELFTAGCRLVSKVVMKEVTIDQVKLNSFTPKDKKMRHDFC